MAKIGVSLKIDVTKLDKARFHIGKKGTYADLTVFINLDEQDQYKQNGLIKQSTEKGEEVEMPILGGASIFWESDPKQDYPEPVTEQEPQNTSVYDDPEDSIPF